MVSDSAKKQASAARKQRSRRKGRLQADKLMVRVDTLLRHEELSVDQQHQLLTVKRYLRLNPDPETEETQAALACAEIVVNYAQLAVYQRRYGLTPP